VSSYGTSPSQPVTLQNISLNMIDNMFIVNPPQEIKEQQDESQSNAQGSSNGLLDFTELDTDYLADDFLAEDDLEFNELDMDLLDVDFLQDVLVALEEVNILKNGVISVRIPIGSNTTVESENEGKKNLISVGDGQSVIIIIRQGG
jgi:hypothetical protein